MAPCAGRARPRLIRSTVLIEFVGRYAANDLGGTANSPPRVSEPKHGGAFFSQLEPLASDRSGVKNTNRSTPSAIAKLLLLFALAAACFAGCGGGDAADGDHENGSEGHCTGTPDRCDFLFAPGCSGISGCSMRSRLRWNGEWDNYCDGVPDPCSWSKSAQSCKDQDGCKWEFSTL